MTNKNIKSILFYVFIFFLIIVWLFPLLFILLTALRNPADFFITPMLSIPRPLHFDNFAQAWTRGRLGQYLINGAIVSFLKVPVGIAFVSLAAFGITRLGFKRHVGLFMFFLVGMMVPIQATLVGLNVAFNRLGLINTYFGLFYVYVGFGIPFGILVMRGFMRAIPFELDEAARIDGCNNLRLYASVIMPVAKPAVATLFILDFLSTWNEYLIASILITDDSMRTVPAGLLNFFGEFSTDYSLLSAGVLITIIPVFIVFLIFQRHFVEGMAGAVKG